MSELQKCCTRDKLPLQRKLVLAFAFGLALQVFAAGEPSFCSLRCGPGSCADENWPKVLDALSQTPRPFDAIWFSTGVAYPPLDWHRAQSARCAKAAEDLKKIGMSAAVEIQMTIGHGDAMLTRQDCRAQGWPTWVGWNGKTCKHVSCPRGKGFRDYFARVAAIYAEWKPECVWIDDDLRLENRAPDGGGKYEGCWCASCVAAFSRLEGRDWTRETLLAAIEKGDKDLKRRWFALQEDGLAEFAGAIARAVTEVSPETRLGLEAALCANGVTKILKAMRDASGKPVRLRSGEGAYWDRNPHEQLEKAYRIAKATAEYGCFDLVDVFSPEIESCPRTFSCRTPQGAILEGFEQLAMGANALSMFLADTRVGEDWSYYRDILFRRLGAAHGFLKGYAEANRGTLPCGFSVKGGEVPKELVACRGVPVVCGRAKSLGDLPDVNAIPASLGGSGWQAKGEHETIVMQAAAGPRLMEFARRADAVSGGKTPILFTRPVMAWVLPRVREDGELRTVALVNCSIDVQDPVAVHLRGVPADAKVTWVPLHGVRTALEPRREGGDIVVTLPSLGAWDCGYLKLTVGRKKP